MTLPLWNEYIKDNQIDMKTSYIALLRGINVGGNNIIKMSALAQAFEECGYTEVSTYIQTGNVLFATEERDTHEIAKTIETHLSKTFNYDSKIVLRSKEELKKILDFIPTEWKTRKDIRCYIAFTKDPVTAEDVSREIKLRQDIDFIKIGKGALYMTTLLSGITKSGFSKLVGTPVYKYITIRNLNTTQKILERMESITRA